MLALDKGSGRYEVQLLSESKRSRILKNLTDLTKVERECTNSANPELQKSLIFDYILVIIPSEISRPADTVISGFFSDTQTRSPDCLPAPLLDKSYRESNRIERASRATGFTRHCLSI
jgi:hypothetical protein